MAKTDALTKILAGVGTVLVWFPILAPVLFSIVSLLRSGIPRFDYLMPAEMFPVALVGGGILFWAALRLRSRQVLIGWSLAVVVVMLAAAVVIPVLTGLATGETEPTSWWAAVAFTTIAVYSLALIVIGVGGVLLLRDLFRPSLPPRVNT